MIEDMLRCVAVLGDPNISKECYGVMLLDGNFFYYQHSRKTEFLIIL